MKHEWPRPWLNPGMTPTIKHPDPSVIALKVDMTDLKRMFSFKIWTPFRQTTSEMWFVFRRNVAFANQDHLVTAIVLWMLQNSILNPCLGWIYIYILWCCEFHPKGIYLQNTISKFYCAVRRLLPIQLIDHELWVCQRWFISTVYWTSFKSV